MNIEELRKFCLSLPEVTEDIKWGHDLCFMINEKMFCVTGADSNPMMVSLKVKDDEFDDLCATPNIISAPYVGRFKWILIQDADRLSQKEWEYYITQSYELIKLKSKSKVTRVKSKVTRVKSKVMRVKSKVTRVKSKVTRVKSKDRSEERKVRSGKSKKKTKPVSVKREKRKAKSGKKIKKTLVKGTVKRKPVKKVKAKKGKRK